MTDNIRKWLDLSPGLEDQVLHAYASQTDRVLPDHSDVFNAFRYFAPEDTKVVVLGQDPYHSVSDSGLPKAYGQAFGYNPEYVGKLKGSLLNISRELHRTYGRLLEDMSLTSIAKQNVLLLNTRLTVEIGRPLSHAKRFGYEKSIPALIRALEATNKDVVYLAWGAEAREYLEKCGIPEERMVATSHPCNQSHLHWHNPFSGSNCFDRVNQILGRNGQEEIKWV